MNDLFSFFAARQLVAFEEAFQVLSKIITKISQLDFNSLVARCLPYLFSLWGLQYSIYP